MPEALLIDGLKKVGWMELMDEYEMLDVAKKYSGIKAFDIKRYFDEVLK